MEEQLTLQREQKKVWGEVLVNIEAGVCEGALMVLISAVILLHYQLQMPQNRLTDDDIADVIAYIKDLSPRVGG